ncbi:hypothetical protein EXD82_05665 [Peptacetobacter hominis]|uniref:Uncharacterized protein n=1 Tax=Peptacetobacter hominis TaxID=2743610 RepID=A0A544QVE9_9FIRM|nr:hypothetical protein [Peptacetobacter hominis]TQQ84675.1 hypothetical protein EXD82_05665 [Peptacetobacter hominis]
MSKLIRLIFLGVVVSFLLIGCSSNNEESKEKVEQKEDVKVEANNDMPGISGTQAYDIILSLEETGIEKPKTTIIDDGYSWNSVNSDYSYDIRANKDHEIGYASFMVLRGDDSYLGFCSTIPSEKVNTEEAREWVENNIGNETEKVFGDAVYELSMGNLGAILTIKSVDWDNYMDEKMKEELRIEEEN